MAKVKIEFDIDFGDYEDITTPEDAKNLVESMCEGSTEWPWEGSDTGPDITIEGFAGAGEPTTDEDLDRDGETDGAGPKNMVTSEDVAEGQPKAK